MNASLTVAACLLLAAPLVAQLPDPLPDLPLGPVPVRLSLFAGGLPVEQEFVTPVFTQRVGPTDLAAVPDGSGRLVITNYGGTAYRFDSAGRRDDTPFLDLTSTDSPSYNPQFEFGDAHGLTSLAFHPDFAQPERAGYGRFYTLEPETAGSGPADFVESVVAGNHHQDVLYEYRLAAPDVLTCDAACAASKRELLRVTQPGWHHNLGDLLFDDQRRLFIGSGDGNVAATVPPIISDNSQLLTNVFGKVLRIDPLGTNSQNGRYGIPADNPWIDGPGGNVDEIYAYGLRNPYRLELDPVSGELFASETGELQIESVERVVAGANHGWNRFEGRFVYDRLTRNISVDTDSDSDGRGDLAEVLGTADPVFQYDHGDGLAVVGVVPYRGEAIPRLAGQLVFADFLGKLFYGDPSTSTAYRLAVDAGGVAAPLRIHSINRDAGGELYVLGIVPLGNDQFDGVVLRMHSVPAWDGDFDADQLVDLNDLNLLTSAVSVGSREPLFDVSNDGQVDQSDRQVWVHQLRGTYFGDANLDGEFNSSDLVSVLQSGEYEDLLISNSNWSTGDWTGDGEFASDDLVLALADGGYEQGPRGPPSVPEPAGLGVVRDLLGDLDGVARTTTSRLV